MRLATTVSVALIALSTAALAQVAEPLSSQVSNNIADVPASAPNASDEVDPAQNMLSDSASPPPTEPK